MTPPSSDTPQATIEITDLQGTLPQKQGFYRGHTPPFPILRGILSYN